jgi:hypothetical protein
MSEVVLAAYARPSFANAATVKVRRRVARPKKKGWCLLFAIRYVHFATHKKKEAERRQTHFQYAVPLARPRIQRDAHIYRRSTAALTKGSRRP